MTKEEAKAVKQYVAALVRTHEADMRFTVAQLRQHQNRARKAEAACVKADAKLKEVSPAYFRAVNVS